VQGIRGVACARHWRGCLCKASKISQMMPEQGTEKDPRRTVCLAKAPSLSSLTVPTQLVSAQFVVSLVAATVTMPPKATAKVKVTTKSSPGTLVVQHFG